MCLVGSIKNLYPTYSSARDTKIGIALIKQAAGFKNLTAVHEIATDTRPGKKSNKILEQIYV